MTHLFGHNRIARGYTTARPHFHPEVVRRIGEHIRGGHLERALDVGCGTGLSTAPLAVIARQVIGVDAALDMIAAAAPAPGVRYLAASAEELPFADNTFDLITVCGAINWIDRQRFLPQAGRLLRAAGTLVIYDGADLASMVDNDGLAFWHRDSWRVRLPRPPRDERPLPGEEARRYGLCLDSVEEYVLEWPFTLDNYVAFLMTQSNVTDAVEGRGESATVIESWLRTDLQALFAGQQQRLRFGGYLWFLS